MDPAEELTSVRFFTAAGPTGQLAVLFGFAVLVWGLVLARRRPTLPRALVVFAAAWLPLPLVLLNRSMGDFAALHEIVLLGPAVTPKDVAAGFQGGAASNACAAAAVLLGLLGAIAALARVREPAGAPA